MSGKSTDKISSEQATSFDDGLTPEINHADPQANVSSWSPTQRHDSARVIRRTIANVRHRSSTRLGFVDMKNVVPPRFWLGSIRPSPEPAQGLCGGSLSIKVSDGDRCPVWRIASWSKIQSVVLPFYPRHLLLQSQLFAYQHNKRPDRRTDSADIGPRKQKESRGLPKPVTQIGR